MATRNNITEQNGWLMIANKDTSDEAAPVPSGNPNWIIDAVGTPTWSTLTSANPVYYTANRFDFTGFGRYSGIRFYAPDASGNFEYEVWGRAGTNVTQILGRTVPTSTGWQQLPSTGLILPGLVIELVVVGLSIVQPNSFTATWAVKNTNGNPNSQEANFQNSATEIRVHKTPKSGSTLWPADIADMIGGSLSFAGDTWTITNATDNGTHYRFTITPNQGRPTEDDQAIAYQWGSSTPIPYVRDDDFWLGASVPNVTPQGWEGTSADSPVLTNNAYGVDMVIEEYNASPDWDFMAYSEQADPLNALR